MPDIFHTPRLIRSALVLAPVLWLAACDVPGLGPDPRTVAREAEAKAVGGACRHAMRGIEDCYSLNPRAPKAAVFAGWQQMDEYMREHKLDGVPSMLGQVERWKRDLEAAEAEARAEAGRS